jgi:hypothetical protein
LETPFDMIGHLVGTLEALGLEYAIAGSMASMTYGEARTTTDLDVVIALKPADIPRLLTHFPRPDYYHDERAALEAVRSGGQFNIIHVDCGLKIDVFVAHDPVEWQQVRNARRLPTAEGGLANFSPPEELIIKKLSYYHSGGSEKHLRDIASMLRIGRFPIDRDRVATMAESHGLSDVWQAVLRRFDLS